MMPRHINNNTMRRKWIHGNFSPHTNPRAGLYTELGGFSNGIPTTSRGRLARIIV